MQTCHIFSEFIVQNMSNLLCKKLNYILEQFAISCQMLNMIYNLAKYVKYL